MSINVVCITGNLTNEPDMRTTANGGNILRFRIAHNSRVRDKGGAWTDKPNYFSCEMFGNKAAAVSRYLRKGLKVQVVGRLDYQSWTDKRTNETKSAVVIVVDDVELPAKAAESPQEPAYYDDTESGHYGEEIPF